jgi:hypothetical protein
MDFGIGLQRSPSCDEAQRLRAPDVVDFPHVWELPDDWFVPATTITYGGLVQAYLQSSKERYVTTKDSSDEVGAQRIGSPIAAGLLSLGIYIAMYLAVAGVVRVLTPSDAVAVAPNGAPAATAPKLPIDTLNLPSRHSSESSADGYAMHRTQ